MTKPYPAPAIPLAPIFSGDSLHLGANTQEKWADSVLANPNVLTVTSGRTAIALTLEQSGITEADEVLIPAYHCESMVSPVKWRGACPVFYKINLDTSIDINDIKARVSSKTRALLVTHYFGFLQEMAEVVELCKALNIILIEDCAHAFFGSKQGNHVGSWGDYAIASSMKFFPVYDGGVLSSATLKVDLCVVNSPPLSFQLKSALNIIQRSIGYHRLGMLGKTFQFFNSIAETTWKLIKKIRGQNRSGISGPGSSDGGFGLEEEWIHTKASKFTDWAMEHQDIARITEQRRKNYIKLHAALAQLNGAHSLFDTLPEGIVPLVYPLYVEEPDRYFDSLKHSGVPIWRFGEYLDATVTDDLCSNSRLLSSHVFQFPCHQELTEAELEWMIETISDAFGQEQGRV